MHQSVLEKWETFSTPLEGRVPYLYVDVKGLVTAGVGNLAEPVELALQMPWRLPDGTLAPREEVIRQWNAVNSIDKTLARMHHKYAAKHSTLRLSEEDIDAFVVKRLLQSERAMRKAYPNWDDFPADAQLGCLSMAWAVGDGFPAIFKNFSRFAVQQDWGSAKACAKIKDGLSTPSKADDNPGIVPRNKNNELCFANAATVMAYALDRSVLHWPNRVEITEAGEPAKPPAQVVSAADRARVLALQNEYTRQLLEDLRVAGMREMAALETQPPEFDPNEPGGEA